MLGGGVGRVTFMSVKATFFRRRSSGEISPKGTVPELFSFGCNEAICEKNTWVEIKQKGLIKNFLL